jgi:membrane protein DedA with SNARE-associated domain
MTRDTGFFEDCASAVWPHHSLTDIGYTQAMSVRTRKAFGTIAFVLWLIVYSLIAMAIGGHFVVGSHMLLELLFYVVAVLPWAIGSAIIIKWMSKTEQS